LGDEGLPVPETPTGIILSLGTLIGIVGFTLYKRAVFGTLGGIGRAGEASNGGGALILGLTDTTEIGLDAIITL